MSFLILNFHGVGPAIRDMNDGERDCWLDLDFFETVLELVRGAGSVGLTFDDGNSSDWEIALPALLRHGLSAAFFVCSSRLDLPAFLSRTQVRALLSKGMSIGSHGAGHLSWRHLPADRFREEIVDSRRILEEVCGSAVDTAACPFGSYDRRVLSGLRRAGYRHVYTSDGGSASADDWLQSRTTVTRSMTWPAVKRLVHDGLGAREQRAIDLRRLLKRLR